MAKIIVAMSKVENGNMYIPDEPVNQTILKNRQRWLLDNGIKPNDTTRLFVTYDQASFCRYRAVGDEYKGRGMKDGDIEASDALIVTEVGHAVFLPVADCVATVFFDEEHSVLMLSHLGRHSLEQEGGVRSVKYLTEHYGSNPALLKVYFSPSPNKDMYPIFALDNKGMKEVLYEQLAKAGIATENISDNPADTVIDPEYYSHTTFLKGGKSEDGRFAMVAMMVET